MSNTRIQSIEHTARDREILRRRQNGETCRSIATDMNLSPVRVLQIDKRGLTLSQRAAPGAEARPQIRRPWHDLTPRERNVALLLERKLSNDEIARELGVKLGTVKIHVHNILIKRGSRDGVRLRTGRSAKGAITAAGRERISEAQRQRWQRWRAARSADNT